MCPWGKNDQQLVSDRLSHSRQTNSPRWGEAGTQTGHLRHEWGSTSQMMEVQMAHRVCAWASEVCPASLVSQGFPKLWTAMEKEIILWAQAAQLRPLPQGTHIPTAGSNYSPPRALTCEGRASSSCHDTLVPPHIPVLCSKLISVPSLTRLERVSHSLLKAAGDFS